MPMANEDDIDRGEALDQATQDGKSSRRFFGAPAMLELKRRFAGALAPSRFDALIARIREIMHDPGVVERTGSSFTWSSLPNRHALQAELMIVVRVVGTETTLLATDRLDTMIVRSFGKLGGAVGAGGLLATGAVGILLPQFTPILIVGWLGGVYGGMRTLYRRLAGGRAKKLKYLFETMVCEIERATV
jgi:hypothetical protein